MIETMLLVFKNWYGFDDRVMDFGSMITQKCQAAMECCIRHYLLK